MYDILKIVIQEVERVLNPVMYELPAFAFGQVEADVVSPVQYTRAASCRIVHLLRRLKQVKQLNARKKEDKVTGIAEQEVRMALTPLNSDHVIVARQCPEMASTVQ